MWLIYYSYQEKRIKKCLYFRDICFFLFIYFPSSQHVLTNIGLSTGWFRLQWGILHHPWLKAQQSQGMWHYLTYTFLNGLLQKMEVSKLYLFFFNFLPIWQWSTNFSVLLTNTPMSPTFNSCTTTNRNTSTSSSYSHVNVLLVQ